MFGASMWPWVASCQAGKMAVFAESQPMLNKLSAFAGVQGPVVIIVMDGYGLPKTDVGSAIAAAKKPTLDRLFANYPNIRELAGIGHYPQVEAPQLVLAAFEEFLDGLPQG